MPGTTSEMPDQWCRMIVHRSPCASAGMPIALPMTVSTQTSAHESGYVQIGHIGMGADDPPVRFGNPACASV